MGLSFYLARKVFFYRRVSDNEGDDFVISIKPSFSLEAGNVYPIYLWYISSTFYELLVCKRSVNTLNISDKKKYKKQVNLVNNSDV